MIDYFKKLNHKEDLMGGESKNALEKKVVLQSFGYLFPDYFPKPPANDAGIIYTVEDVRHITDDPWPKFRESGEHRETFGEVTSRPEVFEYLKKEVPRVLASVHRMRCSEKYHTLQINYGCAGGYQRSVVIARYVFQILDNISLGQEGLEIQLNHLTLPLVMEQKRQLDLSAAK